MQYDLIRTETFNKSFAKSLKKYPESIVAIETQIKSIPFSLPGSACTLFTPHDMRKIRFALKAYKIGKSGGLRLFYLILEEKKKIIPIYIYKKGVVKNEKKVTKNVKNHIKQILKELTK